MGSEAGSGRRPRRRAVRLGAEREAILGSEPEVAEDFQEYESAESGGGAGDFNSVDDARLLADRPPHWRP